jgi:uncharacterized protein (UPF0332 family)
MSYSKEELANYRMERAWESIEEAKLLAQDNHWNTTANRLYYACFYGASAFLIINGFEASTHNGIKTAFNKELISSNLIPGSYGLLYNKLFNLRQEADYRDYKDLNEEEIRPMTQEVEGLIQELEELIEEKKNGA